jgi:hypothetical protein
MINQYQVEGEDKLTKVPMIVCYKRLAAAKARLMTFSKGEIIDIQSGKRLFKLFKGKVMEMSNEE